MTLPPKVDPITELHESPQNAKKPVFDSEMERALEKVQSPREDILKKV